MSNKNVTVQSNTAPSSGISLRTLGLKAPNQTSAHSLLQEKTGILRASIMARRSDFTCRTVIDPNPTLEFGEISVTMEWASVLN